MSSQPRKSGKDVGLKIDLNKTGGVQTAKVPNTSRDKTNIAFNQDKKPNTIRANNLTLNKNQSEKQLKNAINKTAIKQSACIYFL